MEVHNLLLDSLGLLLASGIGFGIKATLKPSEAEAKLIAKVLMGVGMLVTSFAKKWIAEHHKPRVAEIQEDMRSLQDSLNEDKIKG